MKNWQTYTLFLIFLLVHTVSYTQKSFFQSASDYLNCLKLKAISWSTGQKIGPEYAKALLACDKTVNFKGPFALNLAIANNDEPLVKALLEAGADPNKYNPAQNTNPLLQAVRHNNFPIVGLLLKARAYYSDDPAQLLVESKDPKITDVLIKAGIPVDSYTSSGTTILMDAVRQDDISKIKQLLAAHANVNSESAALSNTALHYARSKEAVELLLKAGAKINAKNRHGYTPPDTVIERGDQEALKALFEKGASFSKELLLPLIEEGKVDSVKAFVNAGGDVSQKDNNNRTLLFYAPNSLMVKLLLKAGLKIDDQDINSFTPLTFALLQKHWDAATELLKAKIKILKQQLKDEKSSEIKAHAQDFYNYLSSFSDAAQNPFKKELEAALNYLSLALRMKTPYKVRDNVISIQDIPVGASNFKTPRNLEHTLPKAPFEKPFTQTEAYLSIPNLRKGVIDNYSSKLPGFSHSAVYQIIQSAMAKERTFKNFDVFYHGQNRDFILFYDVIKEMQNWFNKATSTSEFEYIRLPESQNKKLSEYILLGELINDESKEINTTLLPVNVSLFGNTNRPGESTFDYFLSSRNIAPPQNLLEELFTKSNLNRKYIPDLLDLLKLINSSTGNLLQIFIPREQVNTYVYPSAALGKPLTTHYAKLSLPLVPITFKDTENRTFTYDPTKIDMKTYLDIYRSHPEAINLEDMDGIQGRINITHDFLLNPTSGVKIFRYNTVPQEKMLEYKQKLRQIMTNVMTEWEEKHKNTPTNKTISYYEQVTKMLQNLFGKQ